MAKQQKQDYPKPVEVVVMPKVSDVAPQQESTTFGIMPGAEGRWLAVRVRHAPGSTVMEVLTPKRHGKNLGESKHLAVGRVLGAFHEYAVGRVS